MSVTLAEIRERADGTYPLGVLDRCHTALVLFASGFHGQQDSIFLADAGLDATCVDILPDRLHEMAVVYPPSWEFVVADAFEFAAQCDQRFDLLSIDCPTNLFDRCAELLPLWCSLARIAVVLGTGRGAAVSAPSGWEVSDVVKRSDFRGGVYWTVLETA